jgi:2-(3-amino-3-carboxypropyl)histidine synthase
MMYELELERVAKEIKLHRANRVLLQLPDGMRPFALQLVSALREATGAQIVLSGDSCYGACDVATRQAKEIGADLLVHYGHSRFVESDDPPVIFVEAKVPVDVNKLVESSLPHLRGWAKIGLATTLQHTSQLGEISEALTRLGFITYIGEGGEATPEPGQVLGCSYLQAIALPSEVDCFFFVGGGKFHPLGIAISTGKPVIIANPYNGSVNRLDDSEVMSLAKRRMAAITALRSKHVIGVLTSSKPGQSAIEKAISICEQLVERRFNASVIYLDEVRADLLNNFTEFEAFVDTACPRIAIDGVAGVDRPIITVTELKVVLGDATWDETWGKRYFD